MRQKTPVFLEHDTPFPPSSAALSSPQGLVAVGGDLSISRLQIAYRMGYFPWYSENEPILWWTQNPRMVFMLDSLKISKTNQKILHRFSQIPGARVLVNHDFTRTIQECAAPRNPNTGTWISPDIQAAYAAWHRLGEVHSVEAWINQELIGGIYGVSMGGIFHGESMFSRVSNGSKIALFYLLRYLQRQDCILLDAQVYNPHLDALGAVEIPLKDFESYLSLGHAKKTPVWGFGSEILFTGELRQREVYDN